VAYSFGLDGQDQAQAQVVGLEPSDNTGTGNGWDVTVVSTALANGSGQVVPSSWSLVLNGSAISPSATTGLTPAANGPGTYTLPSGNTATYPLAVPGVHGGSNPTPAVVYSAAAGSGMGDFVLPADLWLSVPANALAGSYSATLTWAVAQGPGVAGTLSAPTGLIAQWLNATSAQLGWRAVSGATGYAIYRNGTKIATTTATGYTDTTTNTSSPSYTVAAESGSTIGPQSVPYVLAGLTERRQRIAKTAIRTT